MSLFKEKPDKLKYLSNVYTLDELHKNYITKMSDKQSSVPDKKKELSNLMEKLNEIDNQKKVISTKEIKEKSAIKNKINQLKADIFKIENNFELLEYASKTIDILVNYYEITNDDGGENIADPLNQSTEEIINITNSLTENSQRKNNNINVSDKLKNLHEISKKKRKEKKPIKKRKLIDDNTVTNNSNILNFFDSNDKSENINTNTRGILINKASLQDKYSMLVDKNYACEKIKIKTPIYCITCKEKRNIVIEKRLYQSDGCYICNECGEVEYVVMESEIPSHADLTNEKQKYPYKKINHLKEKLSQFQSKESIDVPEEICNIIKKELSKKGIRHKTCGPKDIRAILKRHRLTIYYEHLQQIYCKISETEPITLSRETEDTIINKFQSMQESFHRHRPKYRSNFLSYSYVLHKIFRILKMPQHAKYFSLLKSKDKLREQDNIWAKICKDMNWDFYSSF